MPKHSSPKKTKKQPSNAALRHNQRKSAGSTTCQDCGKIVQKRGMGRHRTACPRRPELFPDIAMADAQGGQESFAFEDEDMDVYMEDALTLTMPLTDHNLDDSSHPPPVPSHTPLIDVPEAQLFVEPLYQNVISESPLVDELVHALENVAISEISSQSGGFLAASAFVHPPDFSRKPKANEIRIEYHPSSNLPPKHYDFYDYEPNLTSTNANNDSNPLAKNPWYPFNSRLDFEIAEHALETHLNSSQIDSLLSLIKRCIQTPSDFTLENSEDINNHWEAARMKTVSFKKTTLKIPYPRPTSRETVEFDMWTRSLWDWCDELVSNPAIVSKFQWNAERVFKYNSSQEKFERCITEPWTAQSWWEVQSHLPKGASPLCILLYADKTQLSSFGTAKGYPVLARCANLPVELRNGASLAGGRLVGWLPIVKEDAGETHKKRFVDLKRVVWHEGFKEVLKSIIQYSKTGCWKRCGDDILRWLFPILLILSADYEEQCFMALIRGLNSAFPCPICLVPREELSNLLIDPLPERRTTQAMRTVFDDARKIKNLERRDKKLKEYGLRDIENSFWALEHSDVYAALSFDRLHAYHSGLFSNHLWELFKNIVNNVLGKTEAKKVDDQIDAIPRWSGLNHFSTLMKTSDFKDARKYEDISKIIVFGSHNVLDESDTPEGFLLLRLIRSYLELDMYASLTMHTDITIAKGQEEFAKFDSIIQEYKERFPDSKDWSFIKMHTHGHLFEDVRDKGITKNFNSKPNESAHRPLKKFYLHHTNFKDVDPQILRLEENSVVSMMIREGLDDLDAAEKEMQKDEELFDEKTATILPELTHISVGSPLPSISLDEIEASHSGDVAFRDFRKKVIVGIQTDLSEQKKGSVKVILSGDHPVVPYQFLKVIYESVVDWQFNTNILRVNPNFHHQVRNDYVLIQAHDHDFVFAQLLHIFGTTYNDSDKIHTLHMALIIPMDVTVPAENRGRDKALSFTRVVARRRLSSIVISLATVIRGALLVKDYGASYSDEHIVLDVIDQDMWWRMKTIRLATKVNFG